MAAPSVSPAVLAYTPPDPALKEFVPARDRAFFADPQKTSLLAQASGIEEVTPYIGTELKGVQLSKLTDAQKDELALLVAEVKSPFAILESDLISTEGRGVSPRPRYYPGATT
jgi:sulfonate dioxygenase